MLEKLRPEAKEVFMSACPWARLMDVVGGKKVLCLL